MNSIYALLVSNVVFAALLAVLAVVLTKVWRNPQFAHALWLLVLVKLVTPPSIHVPMPHFTFGSGENAVDAEPDGSHGLNRFVGTIATGKSMVQEPASAEAITELPESKIAVISTRVSDPSDHSTERRSNHSETLIPPGVSAARSATQARQPTTSTLAFWQLFLSHWSEWLLVLSGVGTLVLNCVAVRRHQRLLRVFAAARTPDTTLIDDAKQVSRQFGLASCPPVRVTDVLVCPLVSIVGWKQHVLLPSRLLAELSREQTRSVLAHELAHIRRRDHWVRCFELIVLALFWWNPIAWWASRRLRQAEEECCDAWVVWALPECRRSYGQALLRTVEILTEGRVIAPIAGSGFGKHLFTRRIEMIMQNQFPRSLPWWGVLCLVSISCLILPWTLQPTTAAEAQEPEEQAVAVRQPNSAEEAPVPKQALRYDGKDFTWWRYQLRTELKAELRAEALKAMGVFGANGYAEDAAVAIIKVVKGYDIPSGNRDDEKVINAAMTALQKIGPPAAKSLIAAVKDENRNARRFAVSVLNRFVPNEAVVPALIAATEDDDPQVRRSAINALPTHGKDVVLALTKALKNEDLETRYFAAGALGQMGPTAVNAVPALITAAKDEHRFVRQSALEALAKIQPDPNLVVPPLIQALKDKDRSVRQTTIKYLDKIGPKAKAAVPALVEAFSVIDRGDRFLVVRALGQIGPEAKQAIPEITKALQDEEDKSLQRVAAEALKKITR